MTHLIIRGGPPIRSTYSSSRRAVSFVDYHSKLASLPRSADATGALKSTEGAAIVLDAVDLHLNSLRYSIDGAVIAIKIDLSSGRGWRVLRMKISLMCFAPTHYVNSRTVSTSAFH